MTESRWRQVERGAMTAGGQLVPVVAPDDTLARMGAAIGATEDDLVQMGRPRAAGMLADAKARLAETAESAEGSGDLRDALHQLKLRILNDPEVDAEDKLHLMEKLNDVERTLGDRYPKILDRA